MSSAAKGAQRVGSALSICEAGRLMFPRRTTSGKERRAPNRSPSHYANTTRAFRLSLYRPRDRGVEALEIDTQGRYAGEGDHRDESNEQAVFDHRCAFFIVN
jgi:hypothetical protein